MSDNLPSEEHSSGFWFGLAIGGLLGAVSSYFFTADEKQKKELLVKGKKLLAQIEEFGQSAQEKGEEVKKLIEKKAPEVEEAVEDTAGDVKKIAQDAIEKITASMEQLEKTAKKVEKKGFANVFLRGGRPVIKR